MSPVAGPHAPLLQGSKNVPPATVPGAVFNVANSIIGAGIMSLPATLKVLGVVPALALILVVAFLAEVSVEFLMRFTRAGQTTTYAGVMREAFGPLGAVAAQAAVVITNLGCLIMYLIIIADVFSGNQREGEVHLGVLQQWFGIHWWNSRQFALFLVSVFVLLPLVLFRRVESLKFSSAVSTFLAVAFVTICTVLAIVAIVEGKTESPRLFPSLDRHTSFFDLFTAVPVIVTAYTFHFNVHPIGFELSKPSEMKTAVRIALLFCALIYFSIGLFGYLLFGDSTQSDILVNFDQNAGSAIGSLLNILVRLSYACHVTLVFPLLNFSLRTNIDEFLFPKKPLLATDSKRFISLTLVLLVLSYTAAILVPDIWYIFQFVGSTSAVCLAFVFPGSIVLRDFHGISTRRDKIIALVMVIVAVITSVIAISTNVYKAIQ
ncbi:amino acid transporter AVT6C [Cajanus cajan]|uniref:Sodium-coupled neutral amino acid transporter 7 n=1 Tax=Cajanus cajan TaxID=3821 RepID=A0A151U1A8_CAJCA|nr:amino acid transporter AVT6C [Cajanus cajan]KYP73113.1 Putative sodium-coupled neutral amino acid transporter 7 [Cajanus cajan]